MRVTTRSLLLWAVVALMAWVGVVQGDVSCADQNCNSCPLQQTVCSECKAGFFVSSIFRCSTCPAGSYLANTNTCTVCPSDSTSVSGSQTVAAGVSACSGCKADYYLTGPASGSSAATCQQCRITFPGTTSATTCFPSVPTVPSGKNDGFQCCNLCLSDYAMTVPAIPYAPSPPNVANVLASAAVCAKCTGGPYTPAGGSPNTAVAVTGPGGVFGKAVCSPCVPLNNGCATCTPAVTVPGTPTVYPSCATCLPGYYLQSGVCLSCGGRPVCVAGDSCGCAVCGNDGVSCDTVAKGFYGPVIYVSPETNKLSGYGGALPCPTGTTNVGTFGTVGSPTTLAVCNRCAQGYYGSVTVRTVTPVVVDNRCKSCDVLSPGTTSDEQLRGGVTTLENACQYCRGADDSGPGYAMTAQAFIDETIDRPSPYPAQCELCTGGATAPLVFATNNFGQLLPGNRYSTAQCSPCVACNNGCAVCSNTCVSEECFGVDAICIECEDGYGLNYDGHCRKCPPFPAPPGAQVPSNSGIRGNAPFDAQVGCKGCGAVTGGVNSDGSDGKNVAAGPNTGDTCSFCALGYYGFIAGPSPTSPTTLVAIGCDKACPEESTTPPGTDGNGHVVGVLPDAHATTDATCAYCQAGYYVSVPASTPNNAATCTLCPGNSTTAFPTTALTPPSTSTVAAEVCIYCKTGYFISALAVNDHSVPKSTAAAPNPSNPALIVANAATCSLCPHHTTTPDPSITFSQFLSSSGSLKQYSVNTNGLYVASILGYLQGPEDPLDSPTDRRALLLRRLQTVPNPPALDEPVLQDAGVCSCCLPDYELLAPASAAPATEALCCPGCGSNGLIRYNNATCECGLPCRYKCDYPLVSDPWSCNCLCPRWPVDLTDSALCADGEHVPLGGCGCQDCAECPPYKIQTGGGAKGPCKCACPSGSCPANQVRDSVTCQCRCSQTCTTPQTVDPVSCQCRCPAGCAAPLVPAPDGSCNCVCPVGSCPKGQQLLASGGCGCEDCPAGTFQDFDTGTKCAACLASTYNPLTGSTTSGACVTSPAGSFVSSSGATAATLCPAGTFSVVGARGCAACGEGTFSAFPGATQCAGCLGNTVSAAGATACTACSCGQTVLPGSNTCACPAVSATSCGAGFYVSQPPAGTCGCPGCAVCPAGTATGTGTTTGAATGAAGANGATSTSAVDGTAVTAGSGSGGAAAGGGRRQLTASTPCRACLAGYYSAFPGASDCLVCGVGTISGPGATSCTPCPEGLTTTGQGNTQCVCAFDLVAGASGKLSCPLGTRRAPAGAVCGCEACPVGTYGSGVDANGNGVCVKCAAGTYSAITGRTSACDACASNAISAAGAAECVACPAQQLVVAGSNKCSCPPLSCLANQMRDDVTCQCQCSNQCKPPLVVNPYTCECGCPAGCPAPLLPATDGTCNCLCPYSGASPSLTCPKGQQPLASGGCGCEECPAGTYKDVADNTACKPCATGTYNPLTGSTAAGACLSAPAGSFVSTAGATAPQLCPAGTLASTTGLSACAPAPAGSVTAYPGATAATPCVGDSVSAASASQCAACPCGKQANAAHTTCACPALTCGDAASPGTVVAPVPPGTCGCPSCQQCPAGTFYSLVGGPTAAVQGADANSNSNSAGNGNSDGTVTAAGRRKLPNSTLQPACLPCVAGTYTAFPGALTCETCAAGSISADGASDCAPCPDGLTTVGADRTTCVCPYDVVGTGGLTCPLGSRRGPLGVTCGCEACPAGTLGTAPGTCALCPAGSFAAATGQTVCKLCPPGSISADGMADCVPCPAGQTSDPSRTVCACTSAVCGFLCPAGTFCDRHTHPTGCATTKDCQACGPGFFSPINGAASCVACPWGTVSTAGASVCMPCPPGFTYQAPTTWASAAWPWSGTSIPTCTPCPGGACGGSPSSKPSGKLDGPGKGGKDLTDTDSPGRSDGDSKGSTDSKKKGSSPQRLLREKTVEYASDVM